MKIKFYSIGLALIITTYIKNGNKVFVCGNGGSATQANHFASELLGKFKKERKALPVISLCNDLSTITAVANDYSFDQVFSRQLEGLGVKGDLLITFSTSGTSKNIIKAQDKAKEMDITWIALPTNKELESTTDKTQETHLKILHKVAEIVENELC